MWWQQRAKNNVLEMNRKKGGWVCVYLEEEATQPVQDGLNEGCHGG